MSRTKKRKTIPKIKEEKEKISPATMISFITSFMNFTSAILNIISKFINHQ